MREAPPSLTRHPAGVRRFPLVMRPVAACRATWRRWRGRIPLAGAVLVVASYGLLVSVRASFPSVPSNTWSATGPMAEGRVGAAAALLLDGKVLVTGGITSAGVTTSAERYSPDAEGFLAVTPMAEARAHHTATLLTDGRVLVVGGVGADGRAVTSAELYDPSANAWSAAGAMSTARSSHTATLLPDGKVLVAGGEDSEVPTATLEVFDPSIETFVVLDGTLSTARTAHAAAFIGGGRLFIVGGHDGTNALASVDVYDPMDGSVTAGPSLFTSRAGHSATTLLDGRVLVAGGTNNSGDLSSAEIFDPETAAFVPAGSALLTPRQNHLAFRLPHNNTVLILGGSGGGVATATAELYIPWEGEGTFVAAQVPTSARAWATAASLSFAPDNFVRTGPADGLLLIAGGSASADGSSPRTSAELYGFATVTTDKADYMPGETVTISGAGWQPNEPVTLVLQESPLTHGDRTWVVMADGSGRIVDDGFQPEEHDLGVRFILTATGSVSTAQMTFTDNSLTIAIGTQTPNPVIRGNSATYTLRLTTDFNNYCFPNIAYPSGLPAGASASMNYYSFNYYYQYFYRDTDYWFGPGNLKITISTSSTTPTGSYPVTVTVSGTYPYYACAGLTRSTTFTLNVSAPVATTLSVSPATGLAGGTTTFQAQLTSSGSPVAGKTVNFTRNGTGVGSATTNASGVATLNNVSLVGVNAGIYPTGVGASFAGDGSFGASSGSAALTVNQANTTTTLSSSANPSALNQPVYLTATVTSAGGGPAAGGDVTFVVDGTPVATTALNSAGQASYSTNSLSLGNHPVRATYNGTSSFFGSTGTLSPDQMVTQVSTTAGLYTSPAMQSWVQVTPSGAGPAFGNYGPSVTSDGAGTLIVSSADTSNPYVISGANGFGPSSWTEYTASGHPAQKNAASAYDPNTNTLMIYGGCFGGCFPIINEVWLLKNANGVGGAPAWSKLQTTGGPPGSRHAMARGYDPINNRLIVFALNEQRLSDEKRIDPRPQDDAPGR